MISIRSSTDLLQCYLLLQLLQELCCSGGSGNRLCVFWTIHFKLVGHSLQKVQGYSEHQGVNNNRSKASLPAHKNLLSNRGQSYENAWLQGNKE